jgi:hypothetical protein
VLISLGKGTADGTSQSFLGWYLDHVRHSATRSVSLIEALAGPDTGDSTFLANLDSVIAVAIKESDGDPKTVSEVWSCPDWPYWQKAMDHEIKSLEVAGTWKTVPCLPRKNIVGAKWVFKLKQKANRSIDKYKAQLVVHGFTQIYSVDHYDTFSPVMCLTSFHVLMALMACFGWELEAFDFNSAYLNSELDKDKEIYIQEPPSYKSLGEFVKLLLKVIYGLKQAVVKWYHVLCRTLTDLGFRISAADPGVFYVWIGENILMLAVHVDNCRMTGNSPKLIALYKHKLNNHHALTELGPVNWLLGIKVTWDQKAQTISLLQIGYIVSILAHFSLTDAKVHAMPMVPTVTYSKDNSPKNQVKAACMRKVPYREVIGSLMYAAIAMHPDITFAVSILSQFLDNLGEVH